MNKGNWVWKQTNYKPQIVRAEVPWNQAVDISYASSWGRGKSSAITNITWKVSLGKVAISRPWSLETDERMFGQCGKRVSIRDSHPEEKGEKYMIDLNSHYFPWRYSATFTQSVVWHEQQEGGVKSLLQKSELCRQLSLHSSSYISFFPYLGYIELYFIILQSQIFQKTV